MSKDQGNPPAMSPAEIATIDDLLDQMAAIPKSVHERGGEWKGIKIELDRRPPR